MVEFGHSGCNREKNFIIGQSGCSWAKVVVFRKMVVCVQK